MTLLSPHPLLGLVHLVDILRDSTNVDDGAGGVTTASPTVVYSGRKCRLTLNTSRQQQRTEGLAKDAKYQIILEYSPDIRENDIVRISSGSYVNSEANIIPLGDYRVDRQKHQVDDNGYPHHTTVLLE